MERIDTLQLILLSPIALCTFSRMKIEVAYFPRNLDIRTCLPCKCKTAKLDIKQ